MPSWIIKGLATGIKTTAYPARPEMAAGVSPGLPSAGEYPEGDARRLAEVCPTHALSAEGDRLVVDAGRCIHCFRCARAASGPAEWQAGYEWATLTPEASAAPDGFGKAFERSIHIRVVDVGDCGACLNEVKQLNNPYYNMHRLGLFITPAPRHADILLVVGALTDQMRDPLLKAYDAMPTPKKVVAVGSCAISGGIFGPSFVCEGGIGKLLPVDVEAPGNPPPPLAILHALLAASGRRPAASGAAAAEGKK